MTCLWGCRAHPRDPCVHSSTTPAEVFLCHGGFWEMLSLPALGPQGGASGIQLAGSRHTRPSPPRPRQGLSPGEG